MLLDIPTADEFGLSNLDTVRKNSIVTLSIVETLKSIYLRQEKRPKDIFAFTELIKNNIEELKSKQHELKDIKPRAFGEAVNELMKLYMDRELREDKEMLKEMVDGIIASIFPQSKISFTS